LLFINQRFSKKYVQYNVAIEWKEKRKKKKKKKTYIHFCPFLDFDEAEPDLP